MIGEMNDDVLRELPQVIHEEGITSFKVFMAYKKMYFRQMMGRCTVRCSRQKELGALVMVHAEKR
ncbi:hypothetical protein GCM10020331_014750 [Ectobacillus funiculus]